MLGYLQARLTADPAQLLPAELQRAGHVRAHQVVITDAQGLTTFVNPAFSLNTGYTLDEMLGRKPGALLQRADASPEAVRQLSEAVSSGQGCMGVEIVNYRKNGEPFWVLIDIEPVRDAEGRIERFVSVQTEITAQRAALAELDRLRSRANRVAALGLVGFWEHELANGQTWADATCRQLLGLTKGQDLPAGQQMLRLVTPESRQALQAFKEQVTGGARRGLLECSVVHDDGGTVHLQSVWVREDDRLLGVLADVSGTQHLRREREELLGQLELASTAARQFFWAHDLRTGEVSWLPPHGHPYPVDAQGQCRGEDVLKAVLPEDLPIVLKARADACSQPGVVEATYRIRDRQGQVRHLLTRRLGWRPRGARPDSPVQRQIGISVDITTEREQQLQLQVLARENEVVLAAARLAPFRLDLEQMEFSFGPAFARLYGLAEGSTRLSIAEWESRVHPQDLATVRAAGRALRASAEAGIAEARFRIIRPDGAIRQVRGHRSVLRDAQGRPLAVLGAHADLGPAS
jgi:PAS domain S-box-containing protein